MINEKYNKKMMEIKKVGGYVERLFIIENDMSLDVDEGLLDRYVLTLLTYCIDRINRVYIEGEKQYLNDNEEDVKSLNDTITTLGDKLDELQYIAQIQNEQLNENGIKVDTRTINPRKYLNDCDEFGKVSDIVTQDDECNENGGI